MANLGMTVGHSDRCRLRTNNKLRVRQITWVQQVTLVSSQTRSSDPGVRPTDDVHPSTATKYIRSIGKSERELVHPVVLSLS
jgi:hypothetical protein